MLAVRILRHKSLVSCLGDISLGYPLLLSLEAAFVLYLRYDRNTLLNLLSAAHNFIMTTFTMHMEEEYWQGTWEGVEPIRCDWRDEWPEEQWERAKTRDSLILDVANDAFDNKEFTENLTDVLRDNEFQAIKFKVTHGGGTAHKLEIYDFLTLLAPPLPKATQLWFE